MAKRKDDVSFNFTSKKKKQEDETPADVPAEESPSDATAGADAAADPFALSEPAADPFASSEPAADPFASSEPAADPFASADTSALTETPVEAPAEETPAEETPAEEPASKAPRVKEHKQFRILVMGDFSGRANRQMMETGPAIATRKVRTIDADSFEKVMAAIKPEIQLPVSETAAVGLKFAALDDFRPDALLRAIEAFGGMLKLRDDLKNTKTFKAAAEAVRKLTGEKKPGPKPAAAKAGAKEPDGASEFERMLNRPVSARITSAAPPSAEALIASLVAGYEVPAADPDQARLVKLVEDALSAGLRAVLRHPAFQAVESSWRGVEFLTSRLNTDEDLKICIFDISKDEIFADLQAAPAVDKSGLYQILVEQTKVPGVEPFALVIGNYSFEQEPRDIALLAKLAALMGQAGIPLVAGGAARIAGFPSFASFPDSGRWQPPADIGMWEKIRSHKLANHVGLAAPRFMLRLPYGPKTDAIEAFGFEELPAKGGRPDPAAYLWGNGAFAVALCMGEAFLEDGWEFDSSAGGDVTDLPCHMAVVDGDKEMMPCAEGWLSDRIAAVLRDLGLTPLLSVKNAASVKVAGVQSIAKGGKPLAAEWVRS